jgi:DNA-binding response OmpR family regulator
MSARPRPRVLHVDDDPAMRRTVAAILGRAGFTVVEAGDGAEGLATASRGRFGLVILDVDLPDLSGFEVCERLRAGARTRDLPVLHLSAARVDVRDRVKGLEGGADAYLVQPVAPDELVAVARSLVGRGLRARRPQRAPPRREGAAGREEGVLAAARVLRAPLSSIAIAAAGLAQAAEDAVSRARASAVLDARLSIERVLSALGELAHLESRRAALPLEARAPAEVLAEVVRRVGPAAEGAGITLTVAAPQEPVLRCDPQRLGRALEAFARGAIESSAHGSSVTLAAAGEGEWMRFEIRGAGPAGGLALAAEGDIWSAHPAAADLVAIELAVARAAVEAHHGRIRVEPDLQAIHVTVPISAAAPPRAP